MSSHENGFDTSVTDTDEPASKRQKLMEDEEEQIETTEIDVDALLQKVSTNVYCKSRAESETGLSVYK